MRKPNVFNTDHLSYQTLSYFLIILGIIIRLYHFYFNRSLWLDEAMLSNNIVNRSFFGLLQPLDDRQIAPIGFLLTQKIMITLFGAKDYALRIFPTFAGILSIIFFYLLIRRLAGEKFAPAGLLIFITGNMLIFHSTEAKQYGMDVFACIVAFYFLYFKNPDLINLRSVILNGVIGAVLIWFSHCTIIFLTSIAIALAIEIIKSGKYKELQGFLIMGFIWLISFSLNYYFFLSNHSSQSIQEEAFAFTGQLPPDGDLMGKLRWMIPLLKESIRYPVYLNLSSIYLFIPALFGLWYVIRNRNFYLLVFVLPPAIHLTLAFLKLYPFGGRFNLYLVTAIVVFVTLGLKFISTRINIKGIPLAGLILLIVAINPLRLAFRPMPWEDIKSALSYIQEHKRPGDVVYVYYPSMYAYNFYKDRYSIGDEIIHGGYRAAEEIEILKNKSRIWLLMTHYNQDEKNLILENWEKSATLIEEHEYEGGFAGLFEIPENSTMNVNTLNR